MAHSDFRATIREYQIKRTDPPHHRSEFKRFGYGEGHFDILQKHGWRGERDAAVLFPCLAKLVIASLFRWIQGTAVP